METNFQRDIPTGVHTLYKYVRPARVDVLQDLKIRYTQVAALNDPFECLPAIIQAGREWYLQQFSARVELQLRRQAITSESKRQQYRRAKRKEFSNFYKCYTDEKWLVSQSEYVQRMVNEVQGCLSLSATAKNILMWSHYSEDHKGFVIGFHAQHEYFGKRVGGVVYSDKRPVHNPLQAEHSGAIFYTKSTDWSYEQEYRKFQSFVEPMRMANGNHFLPYKRPYGPKTLSLAIMLFPLPKDCIKCVILGWKSSPQLWHEIKSALDDKRMAQTPIYRARPSLKRYEMEIEEPV
jgi:hypothetical protein